MRQRQILRFIFVVVLISIAGISSAQSPTECLQYSSTPLQYDGASSMPHPEAIIDAGRAGGGAVFTKRLRGDARPAYVEVMGSLSNFDADADPDGWRADVILRDRKDRPVVMRGNASFELMPRVGTPDYHSIDAALNPIRWSMPLEFDDDSVARVKLPLRESLRPMLGWSSASYPLSRTPSHRFDRPIREFSRQRTFVTADLLNRIAMPAVGELRVRVSIPTEGVFEAVTPVRLRPSVLVDTRWPYR